MKVCQKCGAFAEDINDFCTVCGSKLTAQSAQYSGQTENWQSQPEQPSAQNQQQSQGQQYYQQSQGQQQYQPQAKTNGLAIAGFVCSFFIPILGLILSIVGKNQIKQSNGTQGGDGLATAGIAISIVFMAIGLLVVVPAVCTALSALSLYY